MDRAIFLRYVAARTIRELYAEPAGRWVTIGGHPKDGKRHAGGTPVKLDSAGRIVAGPSHLVGHRPDAIPKQKRLFDTGKVEQKKLFDIGPKVRRPAPAAATSADVRTPIASSGFATVGPRRLADGRLVGHAMLRVEDLDVDPKRFQYKIQGISAKTGTTEELKEIKRFRPEFGGQLLVWRDPADGKTYVVNGHHRFELARRSGYDGPLPVYYLDAKTPEEARALGALANIAEGRGTALDAAKFLRDSGMSIDELREQGVSLKGRIAADGAKLAKLDGRLFDAVVRGELREPHALAIAEYLGDDPVGQRTVWKAIRRRKRAPSVEDVAEVAREVAAASRITSQTKTLFGDITEERSTIWERAAIKRAIREKLASEAAAFGAVASERRAEKLEEAGNRIELEENRRRAQEAKEMLFTFSTLANYRGPVADTINRLAEELAENPKSKRRILERAFEEVIGLVRRSAETASNAA
ncbi:hypothetical protein JCM19992_16260 [Thermostilla marina]